MAECPSGRYAEEIVTAGGLTLAHPTEDQSNTAGVPHSLFDWSGSEIDYAEWDALAVSFMGRAEKEWRDFKAFADKLTPEVWNANLEEYNALLETFNALRERYGKLRKPWFTAGSRTDVWGIGIGGAMSWDATDDVGFMTSLIVDVQCLRQRIAELHKKIGGNPDTPGDTGHKPPAPGMGIGGVFLLGTGVVGLVVGARYLVRRAGR